MNKEEIRKLESRIRSHIGTLDAITSIGEEYLDQKNYEEMCDYTASVATKLKVILQKAKQEKL